MYVNARAIIERTGREGTEVLLQVRDKPGEPRRLEFPGGQVEPYESLVDALRREVGEETGLEVVEVEGLTTRVVSADGQAAVECVRPFAAYQTLAGPVDSMGVYFRCRAEGTPQPQAGESAAAGWYPVDRLRSLVGSEPARFSWVDRAGLLCYLAHTD